MWHSNFCIRLELLLLTWIYISVILHIYVSDSCRMRSIKKIQSPIWPKNNISNSQHVRLLFNAIHFQPRKHINRPDVHFRECEPFLTEVFEGSAEMIDGFVVDDDKTVVGILELFYADWRILCIVFLCSLCPLEVPFWNLNFLLFFEVANCDFKFRLLFEVTICDIKFRLSLDITICDLQSDLRKVSWICATRGCTFDKSQYGCVIGMLT